MYFENPFAEIHDKDTSKMTDSERKAHFQQVADLVMFKSVGAANWTADLYVNQERIEQHLQERINDDV